MAFTADKVRQGVQKDSGGDYAINNSLRFNDDDTAKLVRTPSTSGSQDKMTFSFWCKRGNLGSIQNILNDYAGGYEYASMNFNASDKLTIVNRNSSNSTFLNLETSQVFRDTSAWYHIVIKIDTTITSPSGTNQRVNIYVNGEQVTDFSTAVYPSSVGLDTTFNKNKQTTLFAHNQSGYGFDGYLAEVNFVDGQALDHTYFGETDETYGHWKPIEYAGTYGTNGFYLPFTKDGDVGNDASVSIHDIWGDSSSVATYMFDSDVTDEGGNNNGTANNISYEDGVAGTKCAIFNGSSSYVDCNSNLLTNNSAFSYACWIKLDTTQAGKSIIGCHNDATGGSSIGIDDSTSNKIKFHLNSYSSQRVNSSFALSNNTWYHIAGTYDGSGSLKLYVNGALDVSASVTASVTYPSLNHNIGRWIGGPSQYFDGRIDQVRIFDREITAVEAKELAGGYGVDASGVGNNWAFHNLDVTDVSKDSPTNNFATLNPLSLKYHGSYAPTAGTHSEGNLKWTPPSSGYGQATANMSASSGKWYWEVYIDGGSGGGVGFIDTESPNYAISGERVYYAGTSNCYFDGSTATSIGTPTTGVIGFAIDMDNNKWFISLDGVWKTYTPPSGTGGTIPTSWKGFLPFFSKPGGYDTRKGVINFGQDSSFAGNKTSQGNSDDNSIGDFYYTPPTGFLALCTQNLPEPDVVPSEHFNTVLWTGNDTQRSITGVGFQPDLVWTKYRSNTGSHQLHDVLRGAAARIYSNLTNAEDTSNGLISFDSDGFTIGDNATSHNMNNDGNTTVAWNWKAGGDDVLNEVGTIDSQVSANVDAGFSIVSYTGTGTAGATIGHGLSSAPEMIVLKNRDDSVNWFVWTSKLGGGNKLLELTTTSATKTTSTPWNSTVPTSSVFTVGTNNGSNGNGDDIISYCFHSVDGYSKVGSYTGNGSTDGTFVHTGFKPAYVMVKATTSGTTGRWVIVDSTRDDIEPNTKHLWANMSEGESDYEHATAGYNIDFTSNGFKQRNNNGSSVTHTNKSNINYIYIAFAENPFKYSTAK